MEERRRFFRFNLLLKGEVATESQNRLSSQVELLNFSREGFRIFVPQKEFLKTDLLGINVQLPDRDIPIHIQGLVKWLSPARGGYEIGEEIHRIEVSEKTEILDYAYNLWKKNKKKEVVK